jgi:hypothetical protein
MKIRVMLATTHASFGSSEVRLTMSWSLAGRANAVAAGGKQSRATDAAQFHELDQIPPVLPKVQLRSSLDIDEHRDGTGLQQTRPWQRSACGRDEPKWISNWTP